MSKRLVVCENYFPDMKKAFDGLVTNDIELCSYSCLCDNRKKRDKSVSDLVSLCESSERVTILCTEKCRLGEVTGIASRATIKTHKHCCFCITSDWMLDYIQKHGGHIVGQAWVKSWGQHIQDAGFDEASAKMHYRQYYMELICFGDQNDVELVQSMAALSAFVGVTGRILDIDNSYLSYVLASYLHEMKTASFKSELSYSPADERVELMGSASHELIAEMISVDSLEGLKTVTRTLCLELFGASDVTFLPISVENQCPTDEYQVCASGEAMTVTLPITDGTTHYGYLQIGSFLFPHLVHAYKDMMIGLCHIIAACFHQHVIFASYREQNIHLGDEVVQKSTFLARMAHELRTPLQGIMGAMQLLETTDLSSIQSKYVRMSLKSSNILLQTITDILLYSRLEASKVEVTYSSFSIQDLMDDLHGVFLPELLHKRIVFSITLEDGFPPVIYTDKGKLREVLMNLIGNAIKFTTEGKVMVTGSWIQSSAESQPSQLTFRVLDTGLGIPQNCLPDIFKYFYQVDTSVARKANGSGLGLSISKGLVELMGGNISVTSQMGIGSVFEFTLPIAVS